MQIEENTICNLEEIKWIEISRNFREYGSSENTLWKLQKKLSQKKYRQINYLFSNVYSKYVVFTKILPTKSEKGIEK